MNTKTKTTTEYAPFVLTKDGRWHKLTAFFFKSQKSAERALQKCKEEHTNNPFIQQDELTEYKVMKRTVITTMSEWEDLEPTEKECEK